MPWNIWYLNVLIDLIEMDLIGRILCRYLDGIICISMHLTAFQFIARIFLVYDDDLYAARISQQRCDIPIIKISMQSTIFQFTARIFLACADDLFSSEISQQRCDIPLTNVSKFTFFKLAYKTGRSIEFNWYTYFFDIVQIQHFLNDFNFFFFLFLLTLKMKSANVEMVPSLQICVLLRQLLTMERKKHLNWTEWLSFSCTVFFSLSCWQFYLRILFLLKCL